MSDLDTMSLDDLYNHLKVYESEVQKKSELNPQNIAFIFSVKHSRGNEDVTTANVSTASTNVSTASTNVGSYMANDEENHALVAEKEAPIEFALMANTSAESKVFDNSLCSKDCKKNTDSLNRLAQVESRLVEHREREIKYYKKIRGLELDVEFKTNSLKCLVKKLETLKKEKKGDFAWTGLPEFKDDTVTDYSRPAPTVESSSDDAENKNSSVTKKSSPSTISSKSFFKFVKANDSPSKSKIDKAEKAKKSFVKKKMKKGTSRSQNNTHKSFTPRPAGSSQNNFDDKGYLDNGCSRHMIGNISYPSDFEPFDEGYVSFGQGGCKITGKGTIKT
nr:hypothetical protein [Tanacetum cinerariifolium]